MKSKGDNKASQPVEDVTRVTSLIISPSSAAKSTVAAIIGRGDDKAIFNYGGDQSQFIPLRAQWWEDFS